MEADRVHGKSGVRRGAMGRRSRVSVADRAAWSSAITERVIALPAFISAAQITLYAATEAEVQTAQLFHAARAAGKRVYFPRVQGGSRRLRFYRVDDWADLGPGYQRILEPGDGVIAAADMFDLVVVPGVAFDARGHRVGRGGGHYDAWLTRVRAMRVGLAFECQMVEQVPAQSHDQRVDWIVTEQRVIRCAAAEGGYGL